MKAQIPPKKWKSPKSRSKGIFCEQFFFFTISKTHFDPTCKKSGSYICLLSLLKFNIEYIAEISKKAITQQKNENSKFERAAFLISHEEC